MTLDIMVLCSQKILFLFLIQSNHSSSVVTRFWPDGAKFEERTCGRYLFSHWACHAKKHIIVKKMIVGWLRKIVSFTRKILFDCYSFEKQCNNANPWVFLLYNFFERIFFSKSDVYLDKKGIKIILLKMNLYLINVTSHLLKQL